MSVECHGAAAGGKVVAGAQAQGGKGKAKLGIEQDSVAAGGFSALLSSLGDQVGCSEVGSGGLADQGSEQKASESVENLATPIPASASASALEQMLNLTP